jgi:hypothetical protein
MKERGRTNIKDERKKPKLKKIREEREKIRKLTRNVNGTD